MLQSQTFLHMKEHEKGEVEEWNRMNRKSKHKRVKLWGHSDMADIMHDMDKRNYPWVEDPDNMHEEELEEAENSGMGLYKKPVDWSQCGGGRLNVNQVQVSLIEMLRTVKKQ